MHCDDVGILVLFEVSQQIVFIKIRFIPKAYDCGDAHFG